MWNKFFIDIKIILSFYRYTRFEKNRNAKEGNQGLDEAGLQSDSLIDLGDEATGPIPAITKQMGSLGIYLTFQFGEGYLTSPIHFSFVTFVSHIHT